MYVCCFSFFYLSPPSANGTERAGELWSKSVSLKFKTKNPLLFCKVSIFFFLEFLFCFWISFSQTSLLRIVGELARGGCEAVAVGVGDR